MTAARRIRSAAIVAVLVALAGLAFAPAASAHNVLVSSDPADGATLDAAPIAVTFTFDQPIENFDPVLKVFGPNGNEFTTGPAVVSGSSVAATVAAGPAGDYRAAFRIVSADGHPVTGEITFTLTVSAAGSATGTPTTGADLPQPDAAAGSSADGSPGVWLWVLIGAAAVLIVIAVVIAIRGPRRRD